MATIFRALMTAVLLLYGYVTYTGWRVGEALATGAPGGASGDAAPAALLAEHVRLGLVAAVVALLAQSVPFAYFLGTGFWVKAFAAASRADDTWERRQKTWLKSSAFVVMALAPLCTLAAALTGAATERGLAPPWHIAAAGLALLAALVSLLAVPKEMQRNSALMDELAERHQVARPGTPAAAELRAEADARALPPLFQLSRVLLFFSAQVLALWLYLRFGTETWRGVPLLPFALLALALLVTGLGLNAAHDPEHPRPAAQAWSRALAVGVAGAALLALLLSLVR